MIPLQKKQTPFQQTHLIFTSSKAKYNSENVIKEKNNWIATINAHMANIFHHKNSNKLTYFVEYYVISD